jgi:hypothetical protein
VVCCCIIPDYMWEYPQLGTEYTVLGWSDSRRRLPGDLEHQAEVAAERIETQGKRYMLYCDSGRNRSALLAAMIVRHICAVTGKEAVEIVRAGRPMALKNPYFVEYLESL